MTNFYILISILTWKMFTTTRRTLFEKMFGMARVAWCLESSHLNLNLGANPHSFMQSIPYIWLTVGLLICSTGLKKTRGMPTIICFLKIIRLWWKRPAVVWGTILTLFSWRLPIRVFSYRSNRREKSQCHNIRSSWGLDIPTKSRGRLDVQGFFWNQVVLQSLPHLWAQELKTDTSYNEMIWGTDHSGYSF